MMPWMQMKPLGEGQDPNDRYDWVSLLLPNAAAEPTACVAAESSVRLTAQAVHVCVRAHGESGRRKSRM